MKTSVLASLVFVFVLTFSTVVQAQSLYQIESLGILPGAQQTSAHYINNSGMVVGTSYSGPFFASTAVQWTRSGGLMALGSPRTKPRRQ